MLEAATEAAESEQKHEREPDRDMSELENTPAKERHSLTLDQRRALRRWANSQTTRPSHKACIEWFEAQYHQTISQSTVSHSLSPKYARLDGDPQLSGSRLRFGNWPDVEKLVLLWHQQMVTSGRHPTNDELAEKAKAIFTQLPRYKDESPPEFSPGWIHRFKKRYGLLMRRQRRHSSVPDPANDIPYLADAVPRFMSVSAETSPAAIRDAVQRVVGVEASLATCARVRDDIVRSAEQPRSATLAGPGSGPDSNGGGGAATASTVVEQPYVEDDPEVVLQNALRALQQEEADAEASAAAVREDRERAERGLPPLHAPNSGNSPAGAGGANGSSAASYAQQAAQSALATPLSGGGRASIVGSAGAVAFNDRPVRCPFCVNHRLLRNIKEAVEHMSTHVVV